LPELAAPERDEAGEPGAPSVLGTVKAQPVEIATRIRAQRRLLRRVLRVSLPVTIIGAALLFGAGSSASDPRMNVVVIPTIVAFFATWLSMLGMWVLGVRDLRNMFRPGSAQAYDEHGE
jgi:hypothetical protein